MLKDPDQERRCCKKAEYEKKIIWKLGRQTPCCWRRHCVESFRWSFSSYYSVEKGGDFNGTFLCIGLFSLSLGKRAISPLMGVQTFSNSEVQNFKPSLELQFSNQLVHKDSYTRIGDIGMDCPI